MIKAFQPVAEAAWRKDGEAWGRARTNLYLVQEGDSGPIKVGIAGHPVRRLMMLQTGNPRRLYMRAVYEGTEATCVTVERYVLRYFECAGGEWLYAELDDLKRVIDAFCGVAK
jgi:hypothetical protein